MARELVEQIVALRGEPAVHGGHGTAGQTWARSRSSVAGLPFLAQLTKPDVAVWVKRVKRCVGVSGWSFWVHTTPLLPSRSSVSPPDCAGASTPGRNPSRAVAVCYRDAAGVLHSPTLIDMGIIRRVVFGLGRAHSPQLPARVAMVS